MYITGASIILTENCNLRCAYCYENKNRNCSKVMNTETAKAAVDFLIKEAKLGKEDKIAITFFGGEPLLNLSVLEQTFDYGVERTKEEGLNFNAMIVSNATIFNDKYEEFLKKYFCTPRVDARIQLSIDGVPKVQDGQRFLISGEGSSKQVEETVKKYFEFFKKNNLEMNGRLNVHPVLSPDSLPYLYESYRYFRDMGFDGVWFLPIQEADWTDELVELFKTQLNRIADEIYDECIEKNSLVPYNAYSTLSKLVSEHPIKPCGAGYNFVSITADGELYPCHQFSFNDKDSCFGNIYDGITDPDKRQIFIDYSTKNLIGDVMCTEKCDNKSCYRCIAQNKEHNGNMLIGFPKYCKMSRAEDEIRKSLAKRFSDVGMLQNNMNGNSCNCNGNGSCKTDNSQYFYELLTPVFANLDEHLKSIKEELKTNQDANANAIKILDDKITILFDVMTQTLSALAIINDQMGGKKE